MVPTARTVVTVNDEKKHIKYSIRDSQNAFLIIANNALELENLVEKRTSEILPMQPFLLVVGNLFTPMEVFVQYHNMRYSIENVAKGVDICFKIYHVFNIPYPLAANLFWTFLQSYFYNIDDKNRPQHPTGRILMNELKLA